MHAQDYYQSLSAARAGICAKNAVDAAATPDLMIARRTALPSLAADMLTGAAVAVARTLARRGSADIPVENADAGSA